MDITVASVALLVVAGIGAGLVGYLTGLASLVSYPALLAVGIPPLTANVTNTVSLVGVGAGAALRAGPQLASDGSRRIWQQVAMCVAGGGCGATLLLVTGESSFEAVVPYLIAFASVMLLLSPRLRALSGENERWGLYLAVLFVVCIYGGYFGAGAGIVYFAIVAILTHYAWHRAVLMKSVLLGVSNLTASLIFVFLTDIDWLAAVIMFLGNLFGGYIGPVVQRYIPERASRLVIAAGGFYLAWSLLP